MFQDVPECFMFMVLLMPTLHESDNTIMAKLNNHFQQTRLDSEDDIHLGC